MMARIPISTQELRTHLADQLSFLEASADAFDRGYGAEAKRMAITLRILLHDHGNSKSVLGQLGEKDGDFISTAVPFNPNSIMAYNGLVSIALGPPKTRYIAGLDDVPLANKKPFEDWWEETVFADGQRQTMTRAQLVRTMADQDGGAHVDPSLDAQYHALIKENSLNWMTSDGTSFTPMEDPTRAAIRQIAHEVLKSLKPDYSRKSEQPAGTIVGGISVELASGRAQPHTTPTQGEYGKVGRNAPCPCGGGKKFKHCHGHHSRR